MGTASLAVSAGPLDTVSPSGPGGSIVSAPRDVPATSVETATALEIHDVSLAFGGVTALSAIDLSVARGEIRAVIGPNGAGKSSLINVISGIYRPDSGRVQIEGR